MSGSKRCKEKTARCCIVGSKLWRREIPLLLVVFVCLFMAGISAKHAFAAEQDRTLFGFSVTKDAASVQDVLQGKDFYLAGEQKGMQYIMSEVVSSSGQPDRALKKSTSIADAGKFRFESTGDTGTYYISTAESPSNRYVKLTPYANNGAALDLVSDQSSGTVFTVVKSGSSSLGDTYLISAEAEFGGQNRTYYLNKFNEYAGEFYSAWNEGNAGSQIILIEAPLFDPLKLDGQQRLIVDKQNRALTAETASVNSKQGIKTVAVDRDSDNYYYCFETTQPATWTFTAQADGTYAISTTTDAGTKYLSPGTVSTSGTGSTYTDLTLSDSPHKFTLDNTSGDLVIYGETNKTRLYRNNSVCIAQYMKNPPDDNEKFILGQQQSGVVVFEYTNGNMYGDTGALTTLPKDRVYRKYTEGYKVPDDLTSEYKSYGEYVWMYTLDYWEDDDGNQYQTGAEITSEPEGLLVLHPVWNCEKSDRYVTVRYLSGFDDVSLDLRSDNVSFENGTASYEVSQMPAATYYVDRNGSRYRFNGWKAGSGREVNAGATISLTDTIYYKDPDFETLTFTAEWTKEFRDPWGIDGSYFAIAHSHTVISGDGEAANGKSDGDTVFYAMQSEPAANSIKGFGKIEVEYDSAANLVIPVSGASGEPQLWHFEARDNGKYYISANGRYLQIGGNNNAVLGDSPQELTIEFDRGAGMYYISVNGVYLDYFAKNGQLFSAYGSSYNKKNPNEAFILALAGDCVVYRYVPAEVDTGTENNLAADSLMEKWAEKYQVKAPSVTSYTSQNGSYKYTWKYTQWKGSDGQKYAAGDVVAALNGSALTLTPEWKLIKTEELPRTVHFVIEQADASESLLNGTSLPVKADETVQAEGMSSYAVKAPEEITYRTRNGRIYRFAGWRTESNTVIGDAAVQAGEVIDSVNLSDAAYDADGDRTVTLTAVWTDKFRDPWGIDGEEYLIVNNADIRAMSTTAFNGDSPRSLMKYDVSKLSGSADTGYPEYSSVDAHTLWKFEAQDNGCYHISTVQDGNTVYLHMGSDVRSVWLEAEPSAFRMYRLESGKFVFAVADAHGDPVSSGNDNYLLDYFNDSQGFSSWNRAFIAAQGNNCFTLGRPESGTIIYQYPAYSGETDDAGQHHNRPADEQELWTSGYKVKAPSQGSYRSYDSTWMWTYTFYHWEDDNGSVYEPAELVSAKPGGESGVLVLHAVWKAPVKAELTRTVIYDLNLPADIAGGHVPDVPGATGETDSKPSDSVSSSWAMNYSLMGLDSLQCASSDWKKVYEFAGWIAEDGSTVKQIGDRVDLINCKTTYDRNNDNNIVLKAQWNNKYDNGKSREVHFYLSIKAASSDMFTPNPNISTKPDDFTNEVFSTLMHPKETTETLTASVGNSNWAYLVNYQGSAGPDVTTTQIAEADRQVRLLGSTGLTVGDTTYSTVEFPDDQEIFDNIQKYIKSESTVTLDGVPIGAEDLNTENFTIRWYVCKFQGMNDDKNYWHIDGKLMPKVSFVTVTKTFSGNETALEHIPEDFRIVLSNQDNSDNVLTLTLTDKIGKPDYGLMDGTQIHGTYGYIKKDGDTYTWMVPVAREARFRITESNYKITNGDVTYGIAAQYNVINPSTEDQRAHLQQWFGTVPGYSEVYPVSDISFNTNLTTNLFNTYVETDVFVIQKRDAGTDHAPMPGVEFAVYDVTDGAEKQLNVSKNSETASDVGRYTVLYENGNYSDVVVTGKDGNVYLTLPRPSLNGDKDSYSFLIKERVPDGYKTRTDGRAPEFKVTVNRYGLFTVDPEAIVSPMEGSIDVIRTADPGAAEESGVVTGVMVSNQPEHKVSAVISKDWDVIDTNHKKPVHLQLTGWAGGELILVHDYEVSSNDEWEIDTGEVLPMVSGNSPVSYRLEETKIGNYVEGTEGFDQWIVQYLSPVFKDSAGNVLRQNGTAVAPEDAYKVSSIEYTVLNEEKGSNRVTLNVSMKGRLGENKDETLNTAQFEVFERDVSQTSAITYKGEQVNVRSKGIVTSTDGLQILLKANSDYYIREVSAPAGYQLAPDYIHIHVDEVGSVTVPDEVQSEGEHAGEPKEDSLVILTQSTGEGGSVEPTADLTIYNKPVQQKIRFVLVDEEDKVIGARADFTFEGTYTISSLGAFNKVTWTNEGESLQDTATYYCGSYTLTEHNPPMGYTKLPGQITIKVGDEDVSVSGPMTSVKREGDIWEVHVGYVEQGEVAPTGVNSNYIAFLPILIAGAALAGLGYINRRKRGSAA